ncbi:MAG: helix-turn-helix transcriptional regulator [Ktedonobacteraceae bacterium]|nr:helix-turn-helix transcriptional regulator [Ktedonobacteraceae bacterium]
MADDPPHSFGKLLRSYRTAAGLTQEELAARAGMSARGISDLERGIRRTPYRGTVELLAQALHLTHHEQITFSKAASAGRRVPPGPLDGASPPQDMLFPIAGRKEELHRYSDCWRAWERRCSCWPVNPV